MLLWIWNLGNSQTYFTYKYTLSPCFPHKPTEVDEKPEEFNLNQGYMLTNWRSSFPNIDVWTGNLFEGWMPIGQESHMIQGSRKVESANRINQTSQLPERSLSRQTSVMQRVNCLPQASSYKKFKRLPGKNNRIIILFVDWPQEELENNLKMYSERKINNWLNVIPPKKRRTHTRTHEKRQDKLSF